MTYLLLVPLLALFAAVAWRAYRRRLHCALHHIDALEQQLHLGDTERRALGLVTTGADPRTVLNALAFGVEHLFAGRHCTILLVDESGKTLIVAGLGSAAAGLGAALDCLPIQRCVSPCAEAVRTNEFVATADLRVDARCGGVRDVLLPLGLRAYWSAPIRDNRGAVAGTIALHGGRTGLPRPDEEAMLEGTAAVAGRVLACLASETLARETRERQAIAERPEALSFWNLAIAKTTH